MRGWTRIKVTGSTPSHIYTARQVGAFSESPSLHYPGDYDENWDRAEIYVDGREVEGWRARIIADWLDTNGDRIDDDNY